MGCNTFYLILLYIFNPIQDGFFRGCSQMGGPFLPPPPLPKIRHTDPTMMKLGSFNLTKEDPKNV